MAPVTRDHVMTPASIPGARHNIMDGADALVTAPLRPNLRPWESPVTRRQGQVGDTTATIPPPGPHKIIGYFEVYDMPMGSKD
jgi:hypothetical protein